MRESVYLQRLEERYLERILYGKTALHAGGYRVPFPKLSLEVFIEIILPAALWPWGRLSL